MFVLQFLHHFGHKLQTMQFEETTISFDARRWKAALWRSLM